MGSLVCNELDVASQGETVDEALKNIKEAVVLYIESAEDLGMMDEVRAYADYGRSCFLA